MALRRSGVRIPLGPPARAIGEASRSCAIMAKISRKVRTGVLGYPVSEKGKRGESPSVVSNGNTHKTELACWLERETSLVNATLLQVAGDGEARYRERETLAG